MNLVPNALIQSMAFTEYDSFLTVTRVLPASNYQTQMVKTVGGRIQKAVEKYMNEAGLSRMINNKIKTYPYIKNNTL
ncbi:MAG: hypothetical protein ABIR18_06645 [Chitinophagaceae bacterium]